VVPIERSPGGNNSTVTAWPWSLPARIFFGTGSSVTPSLPRQTLVSHSRPSYQQVMPSAAWSFRRATVADVDALRIFIPAFHNEDGHPIGDAILERSLSGVARGEPLLHVWMIESGDEAIGYVALALGYSIEVGGLDAFLDEIYVEPKHRGRGIGKAALTFVEQASKRLNVRRLCLEVETSNPKAQKLYADQGYVDHSRHLMSKWL
jgi:GNAT superfamily N-acetyltransferase